MAIPSETIEQVAAANDIVEVIGTYFPLKRAAQVLRRFVRFIRKRRRPSRSVRNARPFTVSGVGQEAAFFGS